MHTKIAFTLLFLLITPCYVFAQSPPEPKQVSKPIVLPKKFRLDWGDFTYWAGSFADVASSVGKREANPLLRNPDGRFSVGKGLALKGGVYGAIKVIEYYHPQNRRAMLWFKFGVGVVYGCIAARNFGVKK